MVRDKVVDPCPEQLIRVSVEVEVGKVGDGVLIGGWVAHSRGSRMHHSHPPIPTPTFSLHSL